MAQNNLEKRPVRTPGIMTQYRPVGLDNLTTPGVDYEDLSGKSGLGFFIDVTTDGNLKVIALDSDDADVLPFVAGQIKPVLFRKIIGDAGNTATGVYVGR